MLNKILVLEKPLAIFDCETTGLDPTVDRVIQLGVTIHYPHKDPIPWTSLINPEIPIVNDEHHGINDEAVKDAPKFSDIAAGLAVHLLASDFCGYNVHFDIGFIKEEMKRASVEFDWKGHVIDPLQIYKVRRGHTLTNCYLEFGGENGEPLPKDTKVDEAHDAGFDVFMTEAALRGQLLRYNEIPRTVRELSEHCFPNMIDPPVRGRCCFVWAGDEPVFNFGKWRGKSLSDKQVRGYMRWMVEKGDFSPVVKTIVQNALDGIFPVKSV